MNDVLDEIERIIQQGLGSDPCNRIVGLCAANLESDVVTYGLAWLGFSIAANRLEQPVLTPKRDDLIESFCRVSLEFLSESDPIAQERLAIEFIQLARQL